MNRAQGKRKIGTAVTKEYESCPKKEKNRDSGNERAPIIPGEKGKLS
jgi:hypothetical protein